MEKEEKVDRRVKKTVKSIKNALITLAAAKNVTEISVSDICRVADINRKTFYVYYSDIKGVINEIEDEIIKKIMNIINKQDIVSITVNPYQILILMTQLFNEDIQFYTLFLNSSVIDSMLEKIKGLLFGFLSQGLTDKINVEKDIYSYIFEFLAGGIICIYKKWFLSDRKIPLEQISEQINSIVSNGIKSIIKL